MDRPPPTSYRDEQERWHPGPGATGYAEHLVVCTPCWLRYRQAHGRGERWAVDLHLLARNAGLPSPTEQGDADQEDARPLVRLTPQQVAPAAVAVGVASYLLASLAWWASLPLVLGWLALLVTAGRRDWLAIDRTPPARLLRR